MTIHDRSTVAEEGLAGGPGRASGEPSPLGPTTQSQRIVSLDVLRGFALLGILVMNIQSFSMPGAAYMNPTAYGDLEGANFMVWLLSHVFADQKFMTIFSILFGAGILLMAQRLEQSGRPPASVHYRRMLWLLLFGVLHGHLLWYGDILFTYAVCGMLVYPLRRLPIPLLLLGGLLLISVAFGLYVLSGLSTPSWPPEVVEEQAAMWAPPDEQIEEELVTYRSSWLGQMSHRVPMALSLQTFLLLFWGIWRAGGLMLIGMGLYRMSVLRGTKARGFYWLMVIIGAGIGFPLIAWGLRYQHEHEWAFPESMFYGSQFNYWGSLGASAAWMGVVLLLCRSRWRGALRPLAAVGQMALSNYLLHTIICTTIFYGHGLGQFGHFSRVEQILTVAAIWVFQLIASPIWLRHFRFGPFEWLWRSLTYMRLQPLRR